MPGTIEIETVEAFDEARARTRSMFGWFVQSVDLRERTPALLTADPRGAVLLGCLLDDAAEEYLLEGGALVFPRLPDVPFDAYRGRLYSAADLYDALHAGGHYDQSTDAVIYAWTRAQPHPPGLAVTLATSLHDHAISDALDEALANVDPRATVGIMGGHAIERTSPGYRDAAVLAQRLTLAGKTVLTGGGPGAMEAANLGAFLDGFPEDLDLALAELAAAPTFRGDFTIDAWAGAALRVVDRWGHTPGMSVGIPTWFYGHEPPNAFATHIAKYFNNAVREDTLLTRCRGGIVYLEGKAGTVQEIFQAVTENYYASDPSQIAPLVLVGGDYWTTVLPAWPLLSALGSGRAMEASIFLVDSVAEAESVLLATTLPAREGPL